MLTLCPILPPRCADTPPNAPNLSDNTNHGTNQTGAIGTGGGQAARISSAVATATIHNPAMTKTIAIAPKTVASQWWRNKKAVTRVGSPLLVSVKKHRLLCLCRLRSYNHPDNLDECGIDTLGCRHWT